MGKKTAKILILIISVLCLLLVLGDIYLPNAYYSKGIETNILKAVAKSAQARVPEDREKVTDKIDFVELITKTEEPAAPAETKFDPMSLIPSEFYIYQPEKKIEMFSQPKESNAYIVLSPSVQVTYIEKSENGYHKLVDKLGKVYYIKDYDMQRNMKLVSISEFAFTENKKIPWNAQSYTVQYDGDRVLRFTKALYLKDNIAGTVEKGQTVYKLRDYGQMFYVAMEDGRAGYMNSQCLETTKPEQAPYDIVSATDSTYAYDEMMEDISLLLERYSDDLKLVETGESTLGYDIPILFMGDEEAEYKIFVQASIHAREYPSTPTLMKHLEVMLYHIDEPNSSGNTYREMLSQVAFYIMPMANPDGVLLSQMGEIFIEDEAVKERVLLIRQENVNDSDSNEYKRYFEQWKSNIYGVDLNRNFDAGWENVLDDEGVPSAEGYKGPSVFSEKEAVLIKKYVDMDDVKLTISYHTSGNLIYWWYYQVGDFKYVCLDFARALGNKSGYELMGKGESRYSHGGVKDYGVMLGKPGITYEIGRYTSPIPPLSVQYAIKRVRVLPEAGYWLMREVEEKAEWLDKNLFLAQ